MSIWFILLISIDAKVVKTKGKVDVAPPGGSYVSAAAGMQVVEGGKVRTGTTSEALLQLSDGSQVKLHENGEMLVTAVKATETPKTSVVLFFGRLWAKVAKVTGGGSFDVVTPTAVAGVRGTEFTTAAGEDGQARIEVSEGSVAVDNEKGGQRVGAGQASEANADNVGKASGSADWNKWNGDRRANLQKNGEQIARGAKARVDARRREIDALTREQKALREKYANAGDDDKPRLKEKLRQNAARLSELGIKAESQFGQFEHWGELSEELGDAFLGGGFIRSELKRMRQLHAEINEMIAEGTDLSMKGMEKMLDDMRDNKKTLPDQKKKGSVDDMFGE